MIRNGDTLYFPEEDKKNVVYKEYSKAKIEEQQMKFKKKQHRRRMSYAAILLILIMMTRCEQILIFTGVAICFVIFLILIGERIDRMHIWRPYYIEIQVEKKLPIESFFNYAGADGMTTDYYPVEGHDLTTGYKSIFYVKEEQYLNAEVGSKIKKSLAVIGDDLPTAPNNLKD